jgi:hypothetical protein
LVGLALHLTIVGLEGNPHDVIEMPGLRVEQVAGSEVWVGGQPLFYHIAHRQPNLLTLSPDNHINLGSLGAF